MQLRSQKQISTNINTIQIIMKFIDHIIESIFAIYNRNRSGLW